MRTFLDIDEIDFRKVNNELALLLRDTKYTYLRDRLIIRCNVERLQLIYNSIIRKKYDYMEGCDLNDTKFLAKTLSECIPKESYADLKHKASRNDSSALLQLFNYYVLDPADFLKQGNFNNQTFSRCKHPEYITGNAQGMFVYIQKFLNVSEIPANCKLTAAKSFLEKMWICLEEALKLGKCIYCFGATTFSKFECCLSKIYSFLIKMN
jgi:hypothetical protein